MITFLTLLAVLSSGFTLLSIWNGALAATGLSELMPDGSPGYGEAYHTFAQRVWLFLAIFTTIVIYVILFGMGIA